MTHEYNICDLVRDMEHSYTSGSTTRHSKYVDIDQWETLNRIDAYINSKHITGETDSMGRDKPFFDIVTAAINIWYRATDLDRKNIRIKATRLSHRLAAFIATIHLQEWMRKTGFGKFLNSWGLSLARYGSSVVKFVEKDGELYANVIPWSRIICDPVDFANNPKIEKLYLTPSQLKKMKVYDQEAIGQLVDARQSRELLDGHTVESGNDNFIEIYEIHGELEKSYLTGDEKDSGEFVQQMHVISFLKGKDGGYSDYTLYKGKEAQDPYYLTHLIEEDGQTLSYGAVRHLFDAQWMANHSIKAMKDQLDLASQLIFQTADSSFAGRNVLSAVMTGDILVHEPGYPLTQVQNNSHDITALQNYAAQWQALAKEINSTPDIMSGNNLPSGTAWRQAAILQQESHSLFEIMTENKALAMEDMLRRYIIPHLKKKMDTSEEVAATLDAHGIAQFDAMYVPSEAIRLENDRIINDVLSGKLTANSDITALQNQIQGQLSQMGNQRFIKPSELDGKKWKDVLEGLEWDVECEISGETIDKQTVFDTLTTVLQTVAGNPAVLQDPTMKMLFTKILEETSVVSAIEISQISQPTPGPSDLMGLMTPPAPNPLTNERTPNA